MDRHSDPDILSPRVLRSSRLRSMALATGFLFFSTVGLLMVKAHASGGWLVLIFGLVGFPVFVITLIRPNRLELSAEGMTTVTLGRRWSVDWARCGEFRRWKDQFQLGSPWMIIFDCSAPGVEGHFLELAAVAFTGANAALPETYGMPAAELAALLNRYRLAASGVAEGASARRGPTSW